jgi:ADP-ribose pyrophosphatase
MTSIEPAPPRTETCRTVFQTEWFDLVEEQWTLPSAPTRKPFYSLVRADGVVVLALTPARQLVLVRQFRPCVQRETLELPCGLVDTGESPAAAAAREFLEETGYVCSRWESLGIGTVMPSRVRAAEHLFLGLEARPVAEPGPEGCAPVLISLPEFKQGVLEGRLDQLSTLAALLLADWRFGLGLTNPEVVPPL